MLPHTLSCARLATKPTTHWPFRASYSGAADDRCLFSPLRFEDIHLLAIAFILTLSATGSACLTGRSAEDTFKNLPPFGGKPAPKTRLPAEAPAGRRRFRPPGARKGAEFPTPAGTDPADPRTAPTPPGRAASGADSRPDGFYSVQSETQDMCMLRKVSCFMIAVAILVAVPAVWEIGPSGPACPGALGAAEICLWPDQYGQMYAATLHAEPFGGQDGPVLLVGILSASAAILAITFTLNQIMLSTISQRYSYRIAKLSIQRPIRAFEAFLLLVAGSAALLLVYDSSPAWLVAYAVLIATSGFFIALWFFARGFVDIMQAMYPPNFIKNVKNKILANIKNTGYNDAPVQHLSEQSGDMVTSIGDTATKSLVANDMEICIACIDVLHDTGKEFLDRKRDRSCKHKDTQDPRSDPSRNAFVSHVAEQFVRIVNKSAEAQDSQVMRHALEKFYAMTKLAIEDSNNADVIKILYETHDRSGSPWWRFVDKLTDVGTKSDKNYIVRHLLDLMVVAMDSHHVPFVKEFITYHIFRSVRTIIDKNDFALFRKVIGLFSYSGSFICSEEMHRFVQSQILSGRSGLLDPGTSALRDKIVFELNNSTKRDFGRILELKKDVELFFAQTRSNKVAETVLNDAERETLRYMDRLYACSLLWGTFFRLACHIIGKGDEYSAYLCELWHHTNPPGQPYQSANAPPCSKDVDWNSLYPGWAGRGDLDDLFWRALKISPHT